MKVLRASHLPLIRRRLDAQCTQFARLFSHNSDDYQYLHRSNMPTYYFQKSLPRLPIPKIEKTLARYLDAQRPLLTDDEFKVTEAACQKFVKSGGWELQAMLKEKDKVNKHTSYIAEPWYSMYLRDRAPLPVNYNPILVLKHDARPELNEQAVRAANVLVSSMRFRRSLNDELLVPEIFHLDPRKTDTAEFRAKILRLPAFVATYAAYFFKAYPLDMTQFGGLFAATRLPKRDKDEIVRFRDVRHVVVSRNGHFFSVDVLDANGDLRPPAFLYSQVRAVLAASGEPCAHPVGALTTQNRRLWWAAREHLLQSAKNAASLRAIDSAILCLNLDDDAAFCERDPVPTVRRLLFDDCANRWYDKSLSVIVDGAGTVGVTFEHSPTDGVSVLRYFNELHRDMARNAFVTPATPLVDVDGTVRRLPFELDEKSQNDVRYAVKAHRDVTASLDMNFLKYERLNKRECKRHQVSPDSVMQLSFQLAFYRQNRRFASTYESCSTAAFRHGRTETMRPCTSETKAFVLAMEAKERPPKQELRAMLDACSRKHNRLTKEAAMGQGFDRHLFALRTAAERVRIVDDFELFKDPAYERLNHYTMSTSTLTSSGLLAGGFGPVVPDGYGIAYNIQDDFLGCIVANYRHATDSRDFLECLRTAYDDLADVIKS